MATISLLAFLLTLFNPNGVDRLRGGKAKARKKRDIDSSVSSGETGMYKRDYKNRVSPKLKVGTTLKYLGSTTDPQDFLPQRSKLAEVAIFGRSNVGKSTLLNVLTGRKKMCTVSKRPGCTKAVHFYRVKKSVVLVDTPGYGYAKLPRVQIQSLSELIWKYVQTRQMLSGGLLLVDVRRNPGDTEKRLLSAFKERGLPITILATKADKLNSFDLETKLTNLRRVLGLEKSEVVPISSRRQWGIRETWKLIFGMSARSTTTVDKTSDLIPS
ncbi:hypothetical protein AAMO2058_000297800 [Amorphochlora amoebiformis]|uniref:EngB-type G domain-containing protein n=1 Tax=Amorphochlora amoebiformis TaxID=1561963 RepID=A0A7S0DS76_9EUKA|mmetsp:Transcript_4461/g.6774  ORF Transcript_4461/g.6774 Transcript_4461/m.6774 type:complete len:270 (+) Transcript_4461:136-945(+)